MRGDLEKLTPLQEAGVSLLCAPLRPKRGEVFHPARWPFSGGSAHFRLRPEPAVWDTRTSPARSWPAQSRARAGILTANPVRAWRKHLRRPDAHTFWRR